MYIDPFKVTYLENILGVGRGLDIKGFQENDEILKFKTEQTPNIESENVQNQSFSADEIVTDRDNYDT